MIGQMLGPYRVLEKLGEGGMGEVYRARDTRLDRTVAIKVLPAQVSADPERCARFEREAKTIAGLNHPHICTLHDVGSTSSPQASEPPVLYLVMEHLTGETLAQRLEKGPLLLDQALSVAAEIADALSAAHRQGVIHRDLKPGNVMLTKAGAKLLDFGIARFTGGSEATGRSATLTDPGVPIGTLPYMAPEQLEGKPADARTDLWALGVTLYEMVTGMRAFEGTSSASLISSIMHAEPPALSALQPVTPPALDRLVRRCLAKAPDDRWDSAHDVADELRWIQQSSAVAAAATTRRPRGLGLRMTLLLAGVVAGTIIGAGMVWLLRPPAPRVSVTRLSVDVRPAEEVNAGAFGTPWLPTPGGSRTALAWTPDGQALIFVGRRAGVRQLYVRRLDAAEARPLPNTEGAQVPAVSLDGQWVAFWANGAIRKVPLGGGPVMDLASGLVVPPTGLVWDARGRLFFGTLFGPIRAIPPEGASAAVTTMGDGELEHVLPWPLPGERALLYTVRKRNWSWGDEEVVAQTLATGARTVLLTDATDARYVPTGHLVFLRRGVLFAVPFDPERVRVLGKEVPVLDSVAQALTAPNSVDITGAGQFALAANGALAWVPGAVVPYPDATLVAVDRRGQVAPLPAPVRSYGGALRVSPDGRRLAVTIQMLTEAGVWVYDMSRGTLTLLAGGGEVDWPIWSPDGRRLVFGWLTNGRSALAVQPPDGTVPPQALVPGNLVPSSFTPGGRHVAAVRNDGDIVTVAVEAGQARVQPLIETPNTEFWPEISPDGRWLAYGSDVSGRFEVYVRPYPSPGAAEPVSLEGGKSPAWHPTGRELFFLSLPDPAGKRWMMIVEFAPGSPPRVGRPRPLFAFDNRDLSFCCAPVRCFDVAPDGQRFYVTRAQTLPPPPVVTHINLITNWFGELKAKAPATK